MEQTRDELIRNLDYTRGMLLNMQNTLSRYIQMEKELRRRQANLPTTGVKATKRQTMIILTISAFCGYTLLYILTGIFGLSISSLLIAVVFAGVTYLYWKMSMEYFGKEKPKKGIKRRFMRIMEVCAVIYTLSMLTNFVYIIVAAIGAAIAFPLVRRTINQKNAEIDDYNQQVEQSNALIQQQRAEIYDQYQTMQQELTENTSGWYPPDYYSLDACEFFLQAIRNFRAENIKEAVNLFEQTEEQKKMLEYQRQQNEKMNQIISGQQEMAGQLRFANMMNVLNFFQAGDINANIQRNTAAVNNLHTTIRGY